MKMRKLLGGVALIAVTASAQANFVFNSSFESNSNAGSQNGANDTADGWKNFTDVSSQSSPDVWDNAGSFGLLPGTAGFFNGVIANGGTKFATIASLPTNSAYEGIESTAFSLNALQTYRIGAHLLYDQFGNANFNNPSAITVRLRQNNAATSFIVGSLSANTSPNSWQYRFLDFSVGATDNYTLIFSDENNTLRSYIALDDVSCAVVPEPGTALALLAGVSGVFAARKAKPRKS